HHFLDEKDLVWLDQFRPFSLNDTQKQALIFVREIGAIDNQTYRQMADCDMIRAGNELRYLKNVNLLTSKGKGKSTYYIPGQLLSTEPPVLSTEPLAISTEPLAISTEADRSIYTDRENLLKELPEALY